MPSKLLITGAPRFGDKAPLRLELTDFVATTNEKQFSLYVQALQEIYGRNQSEVASYFQISGIHGRPYIDWNQSPSSNTNRGYCVHGTSLFATWHRPYVVLIEQEIQKVALTIAKKYTVDSDDWVNAASSLRQPYWGWDAKTTLTPPDAVIVDKNYCGESVFLYTFPSPIDMAAMTSCPFHHSTTQVTTRNPDSQGQTDPAALKSLLKGPIGRQIIQLASDLSRETTWVNFTKPLEYVHGVVHDVVGGLGNTGVPSGHMGWVAYAGFDPIFWAHHAQVDRLIDKWYASKSLWETSNADLTPFWSSEITYWRSINIVDPDAVFNYRYIAVDTTTADTTTATARWSAHVSAKKFELRGSYTVFVFLGKVPVNPREWTTDPHLAGIFSVFANSTPEECANCREQSDLVLDSFVYLDDALKAAGLKSLGQEKVLPFLSAEVKSEKVNLNWSVSTANGHILRSEHFDAHFPSLKIEIVESVGDSMPIDGRYKRYPDITRGRPGGYRDD